MVIPSTLTYIDEYVFKDCVGLETVYFPKALEFMGYYTFEGCESLSDVYYEGSEEEWDNVKNSYRIKTDLMHFNSSMPE